MPSPRDLDRGIVFIIVAIALDLVLYGALFYIPNAMIVVAIGNVVLLGGILLYGGLGFLRIYRARSFLRYEDRPRLRLAWDAFLACIVLDAIILVNTLLVPLSLAAGQVFAYVVTGFLAAVATSLVLLWTAQVLAPPSTYPLGVLALLSGVTASAIQSNGIVYANDLQSAILGRVLNVVSLVLWLLVFVEAHLRQTEARATGAAPPSGQSP